MLKSWNGFMVSVAQHEDGSWSGSVDGDEDNPLSACVGETLDEVLRKIGEIISKQITG